MTSDASDETIEDFGRAAALDGWTYRDNPYGRGMVNEDARKARVWHLGWRRGNLEVIAFESEFEGG